MKKLLSIVTCLFTLSGTAQIRIYKSDPQKNITLDKPVDSLTLIADFGRPIEYETFYDDEYHNGQVANYKYIDFSLTCVDNLFVSFNIRGVGYYVQILDKHTVRIGDSIEELIRKFSAQEAWFKQRGKQILLFSKMENCDAFYDLPLVFEYGSDGTITSIWQTN
ncbi:hypothetical protein [uncultured Alistipes sp.]|uniref:hypothetical protein n=1 Tax=uncultured Alistipes sp. TaxID=538949 RepID=UPI0025E6095D|nr:hypothetical protein [uncultured Alistipes sp.]